MAATNQYRQAGLGTARQGVARAAPADGGQPTAARLTTEQVWDQIAKASFAILGHVTPAGEPRSSGRVYRTVGRRLYVTVAKLRDPAAARARVSVTPEGRTR
jgi:hypothetical protein